MNEKKQNINLYKQLADRQDETNRQLENEVNQLRHQHSMHANAMRPEDLEVIQQEQHELEQLENELKQTQIDKFAEYQNTQFEEPEYAPTHNILGRQAFGNEQIPASNQGYQEEGGFPDQFEHPNQQVLASNSARFDEMANPIESRVINHQQPGNAPDSNIFSRGPQSFQNSQKNMSYQQPPQNKYPPQQSFQRNPNPAYSQPSQGPYNNQHQFHSRMQQGSYRTPSNNFQQRPPGPRGNPLQRVPGRNPQQNAFRGPGPMQMQRGRPMPGGMRPGSNRMNQSSGRNNGRTMKSPKNNSLMRWV